MDCCTPHPLIFRHPLKNRLRGCGQVTLFGLCLSTSHAGEVLEIVEFAKIMRHPSFVS